MQRALTLWTDLFVVWVLAFSVLAYAVPGLFTPLRGYIVPGLGVIMFGMGTTLVPADFVRVGRMKRAVACGLLGQFVIMPLLALGLAHLFRLGPELAMGVIILGACPGGTASNVIAYLAKADVALSVTMTACSTIAAIAATPLLVQFLGGAYLPVDPWALFQSVLTVVLIPVTAGILVRRYLGAAAERAAAFFPALSVLVITLIIATIVGLSKERLPEVIGVLGVVVLLHNCAGMALGYGFAAAFRLPMAARRTAAIEVAMQNSGLAVALATTHFANPLVALPASLFSVVHNLTGSVMANVWSRRPAAEERAE